ncbi:MAG TPA: ribose 5-phosphate isomerase A [Verrucomicrobiae bacterium]|nr:ribose 5-phosphate isomerase A [Verrucomicrobiae bacterium]
MPIDASMQNEWKKVAAESAARLVEDGMAVGLGTGSTAEFFLTALAQRLSSERLRISGIPTSARTAALARELKIPLINFAERTRIDLTIDGADEVELSTLSLIKGHGGALLREKIVAAASDRMIVVADETKVSGKLGTLASVPVEIVQFGWQVTLKKLGELAGTSELRLGGDGKPLITDGGNYIADCAFGPMDNPKETAHHLDHVIGAVEHGLFLGFAREVIVGGSDGAKIVKRSDK